MGRLPLGALPSMRRHPSGQARVRVGNKEYWLGPHGTPEAQARFDEIIAKLISDRNGWNGLPSRETEPDSQLPVADKTAHDIAAQPASPAVAPAPAEEEPPPGDAMTVAGVCSRFLIYAEAEYRDATGKPTSTIGNYLMAVRALRPYDDLSANAFGPRMFQDMMRRLVNERRPPRREDEPPRRWPRQTINRIAKSVRFIFTWAAGNELIPASIPSKLDAVRLLVRNRTAAPERKKVPCVPDERINQTLPHLPKMVADMVLLQRYTGCRPGEVCSLICGEVDRSRKTWVWQPDRHKNDWRDQERVIAIGPRGRRILEPYLNRRPEEYCFVAGESEAARNAVRRAARTSKMTPSQKARRKRAQMALQRKPRTAYTEAAYRRAIARACATHGIPHWKPNQIRHTAGTEARSEGGWDEAQVRLGHKSAKTTEIYAELTLERQMAVAERLG
jgi:integrase